MSLAAAVFVSGSGTNLQALLDHEAASPAWAVRLVVSDRPGVKALERADARGIPTEVIPYGDRSGAEVGRDLLDLLSAHSIDFVLLAGYLRLLPEDLVRAFSGRILNIHPALLPAFGGKGMYGERVHEAVLASGAAVSGATVHLVEAEYDSGRIVAQWPVPVREGDDPIRLAARVLRVEHLLYPLAADHLARAIEEGREVESMRIPGERFVADGGEVPDPAKLAQGFTRGGEGGE